METDYTSLFEKEESNAYIVRTNNGDLCKAVVLALFEFVDNFDSAMLDARAFEKIRNKVTKDFGGVPPRNIELIGAYRALVDEGLAVHNEAIFSTLIKRKVRTLSGIANITVLMKEYGCPGKCIFCPTQPGMPKSYFSTQPAMMRAVRNNFDAYMQVKARLNGLHAQGHDITKIDIRVAGGTWSAYERQYQEEFVKGIYFALNEGVGTIKTAKEVALLIAGKPLEDLIQENEETICRCVGLWVETRPDWINTEELVSLRRFGVTGIELGIQTTDDAVNEFCKRGHGLKESVEATKLCRDIGLKICHHVMPNLPKSTLESDLKTIDDSFKKDILNPDYIKIYPCMVLPYTELAKMCEDDPKLFNPYSDDELIEILTKIKTQVPRYCRIIRLLRDFPSELVLKGSKKLNMRQILKERGVVCKCVRCREVQGEAFGDVDLNELVYDSCGGKEYFLSIDTLDDRLIGLLRLRIRGEDAELDKLFPELKGSGIVRELHIYGTQQTLKDGAKLESKTQHQGFGKRLMERAENIVREQGLTKIAVISAVGTRKYYEKLGYSLEGTYMVKNLI